MPEDEHLTAGQAEPPGDQNSSASMFDYDTRPATPQVILVGHGASRQAYVIRDFLARNGCPYEWYDLEVGPSPAASVGPEPIDLERLPLCVLPSGERIAPATVELVAAGLGMVAAPSLEEYDLVIVGAGPAGLAAGVYAASEGLRAVVIEALAPGGQAGTTSMIENYLGFPNGISGSELAARAVAQARRFGSEILLARSLVGISPDGPGYLAQLSDGTPVRGRSLLLATGVEWRRLEVPGVEALRGAGVYYGAGPSEALSCRGAGVVVVGGGNSAGQAVVRFSRYAKQVTLLVRAKTLSLSMSQYLIDHLADIDNVTVMLESEVVGVEADGRLRAVVVASAREREPIRLDTDALFICIGGIPRIDGVEGANVLTDESGYLLTGQDLGSRLDELTWPLVREPMPLETNRPGLFAAGDVRHGSIKRCAAAIGEGAMAVALVHRRLAERGDE